MIKIETIENDIKHLIEHLEFMNGIINSYSIVNDIFKKNNIDLAKDFETEIENLQSVLILAQLEISLVLKSIHYSKSEAEEKHLIKRGILILYESKVTLDKLNPTLKLIKKEYPELETQFKSIIEIIKQFKKRINYEKRIVEIRNNISAHINPNFLEYYNYLNKIDLKEDLHLLIRFKLILNEIDSFLYKVRTQKK